MAAVVKDVDGQEIESQAAVVQGRGLIFRASLAGAALLGLAGMASYSGADTLVVRRLQAFPGNVEESTGSAGKFEQAITDGINKQKNAIGGFLGKIEDAIQHPPKPGTGHMPTLPPLPVPSGPADHWTKGLKALAPAEDRHDANPCGTDEELYEGLCYMKCALLTQMEKPVRCGPHFCEPLNARGEAKCGVSAGDLKSVLSSPSFLPCTGFDVAGTAESGDTDHKVCPHPPGACLKNEELHMDTCLKKCDILTNGQFPHRKAFMTCCKSNSMLKALMPGQCKTAMQFDVGGGAGDNDPSTPNTAHSPIGLITER
eukprot:TRINITY_DN93434_c0_g1_i1.p1 TRINITY_DN93434_c0_g1~~TRINITY_DN93434_c0_g1_i1.p1  ORF type:complete len:314 (+),score=70.19 TRINITY_DN93434_c0_g1_i1:83-1024(+)